MTWQRWRTAATTAPMKASSNGDARIYSATDEEDNYGDVGEGEDDFGARSDRRDWARSCCHGDNRRLEAAAEGRGCCWLDGVDAGESDLRGKALDCYDCTGEKLRGEVVANGDGRGGSSKAATVLEGEERDDVGAAVVVGGSWGSADYCRFYEEDVADEREESDDDNFRC